MCTYLFNQLADNMLTIFLFLDDNGSQKAEAQNDIPWNWWLNLVAIQSEVAQSRNTFIYRVIDSIDGNRTDVGATYACKKTKQFIIN